MYFLLDNPVQNICELWKSIVCEYVAWFCRLPICKLRSCCDFML